MASHTTNGTNATLPENIASRLQRYKDLVFQNGISDYGNSLKQGLEGWKHEKLNIAVIGSSGQGKSTFINTMRRLRPTDPGAAEVGNTQTTITIKDYPDSKHPNLVYWDLPGCGTPAFPCHTYLEKVNFNMYHFFLIITSKRFTDDDLWLTNQVTAIKKGFYFIRTKIDEDIKNEQEDYPERQEKDILFRIKNECFKNLQQHQNTQNRIF
jgi:GTPase Era involved in 16S rRNA processing